MLATPQLTEGPFYPDKMPLDTDNDLIIVNDSLTPAIGDITHLTGRILNASGEPMRNAFVEIWQVDNNGIYLNSRDQGHGERDKNFQGYGRFLTDSDGHYYFRTIKPVPYTGRTPHIHFGISQNGRRVYTTQLFIKGHPQNERDGVFQGIRDPKSKELVLVDFKPIENSKIGELSANFDIVMGKTPEDPERCADQRGHRQIGNAGRRRPRRTRRADREALAVQDGGPGGRGRGPGPGGPGGGPPGGRGPGGFGPPPNGQ